MHVIHSINTRDTNHVLKLTNHIYSEVKKTSIVTNHGYVGPHEAAIIPICIIMLTPQVESFVTRERVLDPSSPLTPD